MSDQGGYPPAGGGPWGRDDDEPTRYAGRVPPYDPPPPPEPPRNQVQPYGRSPYGQSPASHSPAGQPPYGPAPHGQQPYGQAPYEQAPYEQAPYGQAPYGQLPAGYGPPGYGPPGYGQLVPYYGQQGPYAYYAPRRAAPADGLAIGSMVCGIGSVVLVCCAVGFSPFGLAGLLLGGTSVVLGFVSRRKIEESGGAKAGGGMALAGIICGFVAAGIGLIVLVLAAIWFGLAIMTMP